MQISIPLASKATVDYILILFNDLGYDTLVKQRDFILTHVNRSVFAVSDLTQSEGSVCINFLKAQKDENNNRRP